MRLAAWSILCGVVAGCDREPVVAPVAEARGVGVEVSVVTPLPPARRTHLAPTGAGQVFWVQEAERGGGRETVFAVADGGLPAATKLGNAAILEALGEPGASGSITSVAAARDGRLYFFLTGVKGRRTVAAFGVFPPGAGGRPQILLDAAGLARESGMGDSLALARGSVIRTAGGVVWLWLRHDDGYALLSMDEKLATPVVRRPFAQVRVAAVAATAPVAAEDGMAAPRVVGAGLRLTSAREDLAAGPGSSLAYVDRRGGKLWRIDALGEATVAADLADLPKDVTAPALDEGGRMVLFAPQGPTFFEPPVDFTMPAEVDAAASKYPALVVVDGGGRRETMGPKAFVVPAQVNLRALAPAELVRDRGGWLAYDSQTGALVRLKVVGQ